MIERLDGGQLPIPTTGHITRLGLWSAKLPAGSYRIRVEPPGRSPRSKEFTIPEEASDFFRVKVLEE